MVFMTRILSFETDYPRVSRNPTRWSRGTKTLGTRLSLFQFGFSRKKRHGGESDEGNSSEEGRRAKEKKVEQDVPAEILKPEGNYERRRVRKSTWCKDCPWLVYNLEKNQTHCKFCVDFPALADKSSSLYTATSSFQRTTLQAHTRSKAHHNCSEAYHARENQDAAPMQRVLRNMNSQTQEKLIKLFNTAYFISKENLSFKLSYVSYKINEEWSRPRRDLPERPPLQRIYPGYFVRYEKWPEQYDYCQTTFSLLLHDAGSGSWLRTSGSVGWAPGYHVGGREFDSGPDQQSGS